MLEEADAVAADPSCTRLLTAMAAVYGPAATLADYARRRPTTPSPPGPAQPRRRAACWRWRPPGVASPPWSRPTGSPAPAVVPRGLHRPAPRLDSRRRRRSERHRQREGQRRRPGQGPAPRRRYRLRGDRAHRRLRPPVHRVRLTGGRGVSPARSGPSCPWERF
ncbi:hypothetical protein [Streptomyces sp. NPDC003247]|uniref:hypothetical protein n=1 Tax=Streptomyces sp. NPDC003247 TaxID=3364677 RepID=UPI00369AA4A5